jgi:branched-chain amino acid transport system ATP-binding protein
MLKVSNIDVYHGAIQALKAVSLFIEEGSIVSIVGSNGAGKTTLLNTISGLLRCSSGVIEFLGERIDNLDSHEIVKRGLIQIPEGRLLFPEMTTFENLEMGAYSVDDRKGFPQSLKLVYELFPLLRDRRNQAAGSLSGGEQQMLAIGRGLMAKPKTLMLDEPSLGLSPILVRSIFEIIKRINQRGTTVFLVEQNVYHSLFISNKGYVIENGAIALEGKGGELITNEQVRKSYLGM